MAENTKIQWCDHTFNPVRGCQHATLPDGSEHPGCANCYADAQSRRNPKVLGVWGPNGTRVVAADEQWHQVARWNDRAKRQGVRQRVFVASLADVFEDWPGVMHSHTGELLYTKNQDSYAHSDGATAFMRPDDWRCVPSGVRQLSMDDVRARLFRLIDACPHLDFLLVTKRPENVRKFWPQMVGTMVQDFGRFDYRRNVWLLTSVSDQATADAMIPKLLECRDLCPVLGVSAEPLLGPITLDTFEAGGAPDWLATNDEDPEYPTLDWVIVGGESGPGARPCRVEWIRDIVEQCRMAGVPCFVKQVGKFVIDRNDAGFNAEWNDGEGWSESCEVEHNIHGFREEHQGADCRIRTRDPKGGDPAEWPEDLRVREFPEVPA